MQIYIYCSYVTIHHKLCIFIAELKYPFPVAPGVLTEQDKSNCPNKDLLEMGFWIDRVFKEKTVGEEGV